MTAAVVTVDAARGFVDGLMGATEAVVKCEGANAFSDRENAEVEATGPVLGKGYPYRCLEDETGAGNERCDMKAMPGRVRTFVSLMCPFAGSLPYQPRRSDKSRPFKLSSLFE